MIPVTEGVECIIKKNCNDHDKKDLTTTNEQRKVITNDQNSIKMDEVNTEINECDTQLPPRQYQQNNPSSSVESYQYRHHASLDNLILSEQSSSTRDILENEDNITNNLHDLENTNIDNSEYESKTMIAKTQEKKSPISILNQWAIGGKGRESFTVSYVLTGVAGQSHNPIFTYMCQIQNTTALGEGTSKKKAKRNAAAQMCEKLFDFKIDSLNDNDTIITSTTTTDNFEVNENDDTFLSCTEDETNSDISDEELQQFKCKDVQMEYCNMNPIGALSELCTTHKWTPPFYSLKTISKDQTIHKTTLHIATCKVYHLQLKGTANSKKGAKRYAARLMFETIVDIGIEKFNEFKFAYPITKFMYKDGAQSKCIDIYNEENQKQLNHWFSAHCFRSHFTIATSTRKVMNDTTKLSSVKDTMDLEQYIKKDDPNVSKIDKLDTVCKELGYEVTYVCLGAEIKEDEYVEYAVLVQVTSMPVTITIGCGATPDKATEEAAKNVLEIFKVILHFTKPATINLKTNEEKKITYIQ